MEHVMRGWHQNRAPALDEIIVTRGRDVIASRPLPREISDDRGAWDRVLHNLGYSRVGEWTPTEGGAHCCTVAPDGWPVASSS